MIRKSSKRRNTFINVGCGSSDQSRLPPLLRKWKQVRVDVDPDVKPDIVADIVDLSAISDGSADAVWCSHCVEHLFAHQVPQALAEFRRVLSASGFACIIVPDLQMIAHWIATDRLHETIYQSPSGPVTSHDMVWGFGAAIANGKTAMAHHCGFTPTLFVEYLQRAGFPEIVLRRRTNTLELAALALKKTSASPKQREALMADLAL